ncbi:hypothetical protein HDV00_001857 [Rhizophlyctis rosea]|nr:hypothetical protein HDV00_001857 [Rhizophlyctis rosea]
MVGQVESVFIPDPYARCAFVVFSDAKSVSDAIGRSSWKSIYPGMDVKGLLEEDEVDDVKGKIPYRIMSKSEWIKRMDEYSSILEKKRAMEERVIQDTVGTHELHFQEGLVAEFAGVHQKTNRKVLKRLFEMIAPVAYVDYTINQTSGFARFKSPHGAVLACTYFSRECVTQMHENDTGTLLVDKTKKRTKARIVEAAAAILVDKDGGSGDVDVPMVEVESAPSQSTQMDPLPAPVMGNFITLKLLKGSAEKEYWGKITQGRVQQHVPAQTRRQERRPRPYPAPTSKTASSSATTAKPTHITFDESEEE